MMEDYRHLTMYQKVNAIEQNANWHDGKLQIPADEYAFLCEVAGQENDIKEFADDYKELTPVDFSALITIAKKRT